MESKNIVSFGAGQNSTAMIILMYNKGIKIDEIIFSDVGNEYPETYNFITIFKVWCLKSNIKFTEVRSKLYPLMEDHFNKKIIPYRMFRSCTHKFKIIPINKYIKENYKGYFINMFMGIASDEKKRAKESGVKNQEMIYPLIEHNIDRGKCVEIIRAEGLPVPIKSGCYFCPFQSKKGWIELYKNHKDIYNKCIEFEENGRGFPEGKFLDISLRELKKIIKEQTNLNNWLKKDIDKVQQCVYCHL